MHVNLQQEQYLAGTQLQSASSSPVPQETDTGKHSLYDILTSPMTPRQRLRVSLVGAIVFPVAMLIIMLFVQTDGNITQVLELDSVSILSTFIIVVATLIGAIIGYFVARRRLRKRLKKSGGSWDVPTYNGVPAENMDEEQRARNRMWLIIGGAAGHVDDIVDANPPSDSK